MSDGKTKSATAWVSVTPSDSTVTNYRAIWVNGAGDIALRDDQGNDETFTVIAGTLLPLQPTRVLSTGTTATGIIGLN
jgi:hypothetical protein